MVVPLRVRIAWTAASFLVGTGCGEEATPPVDAAASDAAADAAVEIAAPALPTLLPCPAGWREVAAAGEPTVCEPWPEGGRGACADDEAHFPGEETCARIGTACPVGDFAEDLPADAPVLYALAGAAAGDGSLAAPFATLTEAASAARPGDVVAVGRGRYDEALRLRGGFTLRGACVAETILTSTAPSDMEGVLMANRTGEMGIENLSIVGPERPGVSATGPGALRLSDVLIDGARVAGARLVGGTLDGSGIVVRGTTSVESTGLLGEGIFAANSSVELVRAVLERNREVGILIFLASVRMDGVAVRETLPSAIMQSGRGIELAMDGSLDARRSVFELNIDTNIVAGGDTSTVRLEDTVFRDTDPEAGDTARGRGVEIQGGASGEMRRTLIERTHDGAIIAGQGGTLLVEDLVVRDTDARLSDGQRGRALAVQNGLTATVRRAWFERSREVAVMAAEDGADLRLEDVHILQTLSRACAVDTCADEALGVGLGSFRTGRVHAERFVIEGAEVCGMQLAVGGEIDLLEGRVTGAEVGACIQVPGYDLARLTTRVEYRDNGINLDATELPVPETL